MDTEMDTLTQQIFDSDNWDSLFRGDVSLLDHSVSTIWPELDIYFGSIGLIIE